MPYRRRPVRTPTHASKTLMDTRLAARLTMTAVGKMLGLHYRTIRRWETGETRPNAAEWAKLVACFARVVPEKAAELATVVGAPLPAAEPPDVVQASATAPPEVRPTADHLALEYALLRAADHLDLVPACVRAAVRDLLEATAAAHGTLDDLLQAAQERSRGTEG